ncbi:MAG: four helix bundle protein [Saprospiraceae bacterium]|nr:four helix bundle protein [Saprospiraceae bacterium]
MKGGRENIILIKSFAFAVRIVKLCRYLRENKSEYVLSKQLVRSGTSIGANAEEANGALTKKDFINKLHIALKEARETHYWLRLLNETDYITETEFDSILKDAGELISILTAILKSAKENDK